MTSAALRWYPSCDTWEENLARRQMSAWMSRSGTTINFDGIQPNTVASMFCTFPANKSGFQILFCTTSKPLSVVIVDFCRCTTHTHTHTHSHVMWFSLFRTHSHHHHHHHHRAVVFLWFGWSFVLFTMISCFLSVRLSAPVNVDDHRHREDYILIDILAMKCRHENRTEMSSVLACLLDGHDGFVACQCWRFFLRRCLFWCCCCYLGLSETMYVLCLWCRWW